MLRLQTLALAPLVLALAGCPSTSPSDVVGNDATDLGFDSTMQDSRGDALDSGVPLDGGTCGAGLGTCNPVTNEGCAVGQACIVASGNDGGTITQCAPPGTGTYNTPCHTANGCLEGFGCFGGTCLKLCCGLGQNDACRTGNGGMNGAVCNVQLVGVNFWGCTAVQRCDWFAQDCPSGQNCQPLGADGTTSCQPAGTGAAGAQCAAPAGSGITTVDCGVGLTCIGSSDAGFCRQICDPTIGPTDDAGTTPDGGVSRACATGFRCTPINERPNNFGGCEPM